MIFSQQTKVNLENIRLPVPQSINPHKALNKFEKENTNYNKNLIQTQKNQTTKNLSDLVTQYKTFLQYGPAMGIYVLPKLEDFFSWEFYLFLREGYYKDAKLKGEIKFDHEKSHQIVSLNFSSPVLHPLVNFQNGTVDLPKICPKNSQSPPNLFEFFSSLKKIFFDQDIFLVKDSFNPEAAKTYQKSQTLFIEKVFQTTVIPSQECLFKQFQDGSDNGFKKDQIFTQSYQIVDGMKQKLKQVCPNSFQSLELVSQDSVKQNEQTVQKKAERFLEIIMNRDFHYEL